MSVSEDWPEGLRSVVLGEDAGLGDARAMFFARVMPPDAIQADAEGLALAGLVMQAFGRLPPEIVARRLPSLRVCGWGRGRLFRVRPTRPMPGSLR